MITRYLAAATLALGLGTGVASAQSCGGIYTVKSGDTLSGIADTLYKDARKWSVIYQNNLSVIGNNPDQINIGHKYTLTCLAGLPLGLSGGTTVTAEAETEELQVTEIVQTSSGQAATAPGDGLTMVRLLTADDYAPFTDRKVLNGGLVTEIVDTAMKANPTGAEFGIHWVNDWSAHLEPLLSNAMLDAGFPWLQPDCASTPDNYRCKNFLFSEPMFEMLVLLFTDKNRPVAFNSDADMIGKTLCRPQGYYTHDLEKNGRLWVSGGKITLKQPVSVAECFELLEEGEVDAVALNEFTGRAAIKDLNMSDKVEVVQSRPLSIEGLHVVVHKTHPKADELVALFNDSLDSIKKSGEYQRIIDTHMTKIWEDF